MGRIRELYRKHKAYMKASKTYNTSWRIFRSLLVIYVTVSMFACGWQSKMIYFPSREMTVTPGFYGLPFEDVTLPVGSNTVNAWFIPADAPRATLLFCHGNAGNISDRLDSLRIFHKLDLDVLIFDYEGYGKSSGKPSEKATYADARAAWDYLVEVRKVPPERLLLFGRSLGAAIASHLSTEVRPAALILESSFTSVPDIGKHYYPWLPIRLISRFSYNTRKNVAQAPCPVLIVHSPDDDIIPYSHGLRLFEAAPDPKEFLEITGDHNTGFIDSCPSDPAGLDAFLTKHLPNSAPAP